MSVVMPSGSRRDFLRTAGTAVAACCGPSFSGAEPARFTLDQRGFYLCFMRMPSFGLEVWKEILDDLSADGVNTIILWMGGAFRSKKYPITWHWAQDHENVRQDFAGRLIDHAHGKGVKVLLGFTPFGYDGVNQLPLERPDLKATGPAGRPVAKFGIGCWGWNLCPAREESQTFMREYVREMAFEFYPAADGLFIESSDYAICHCPRCGPKFFEHEFSFVRDISEEFWKRNPGGSVVVYPHYFSGAKLRFSFSEATAARLPFDSRWTLFFTPHSAAIEPGLIARAKGAWWWNEAPSRFDLAGVRAGVRRARDSRCNGYLPSLECYSYVVTHTEFGEPWFLGRRQVPFGFGWLGDGENPYRELPVRAVLAAWRELCKNPDLSEPDLQSLLGRELFGRDWQPQYLDDLHLLLRVLNTDRDWSVPGALTMPGLVRDRAERGHLDAPKRALLREQLAGLRAMLTRYGGSENPGLRQLCKIARWFDGEWTAHNEKLLAG